MPSWEREATERTNLSVRVDQSIAVVKGKHPLGGNHQKALTMSLGRSGK